MQELVVVNHEKQLVPIGQLMKFYLTMYQRNAVKFRTLLRCGMCFSVLWNYCTLCTEHTVFFSIKCPFWSTILLVLSLMLSWQVSHKINELSFGAHFPGVVNPLDGYVLLTFVSHIPSLAFQSLFILSALCCWWSRYYPPRASTSQVFYLRPEA